MLTYEMTYCCYGGKAAIKELNFIVEDVKALTTPEASCLLTVGMAIFAAPESGADWLIICAATLLLYTPLLALFLFSQCQLLRSFIQGGKT